MKSNVRYLSFTVTISWRQLHYQRRQIFLNKEKKYANKLTENHCLHQLAKQHINEMSQKSPGRHPYWHWNG